MGVRNIIIVTMMALLGGCATPTPRTQTYDLIKAEMRKAAEQPAPQITPDAVAAALLPPLQIDMPNTRRPVEERFSVSFNNVPASQFFMSIVSGTRYNMLVHPDVTGTISANLKDVTLFEALDAIRELYGYDYKVDGTRIVIKPLTLQTKVFQVNYLTGNRKGSSDTRVVAGSFRETTSGNNNNNSNNGNNNNGNNNNNDNNNNNGNNNNNRTSLEGAKVKTSSVSDFWTELRAALEAIVGPGKEGRSIVISPQSGVVVVRAMPDELRSVDAYLRASQLSIDRQVILEAKILEVQLNDDFQTGVNWAAFQNRANSRLSTGLVSPGATMQPLNRGAATPLVSGGATAIAGLPGAALSSLGTSGSMFGLAFQTSNFAALISFLDTQGSVHVLSSPRIATLNNQKAVLKVGTDEFFVTGVSSTTTTTGTAATTTPSLTLEPFFSGVVLDVTPQIDDHGNVILHIHPSVTQVSTVNKSIDLGSLGGSINIPLASSNTSETDSVVRGRDGQIVAIGGLMRQATVNDRSQVPGLGNAPVVGNAFKNTNQSTQKRELVILLKPTVVQGNSSWSQDITESQERIQALDPRGAQGL